MSETKLLQQYNTHPATVKLLTFFAESHGITNTSTVLDPSCGTGSILEGIIRYKASKGATFDEATLIGGIDIDLQVVRQARSNLTNVLIELYPDVSTPTIALAMERRIVHADFMEVYGFSYDFVIMNPPFTTLDENDTNRGRPAYYDHVRKAYFHSNSKTIAIIPARWYMAGRMSNAFRLFMCDGKVSTLIDFSGDISLFVDSINLVGGICIAVLDKLETHRETIVINVHDGKQISRVSRPLDEFGENFVRSNETAAWLRGSISPHRMSERLAPYNCFYLIAPPKEDGDTICYTTGNNWKPLRVHFKEAWRTEGVDPHSYNIFVTRVGFYRDNIKRAFVANPGDICTSRVLCIRGFRSKEKTEQLLQYLQQPEIINLCNSCQTALGMNDALFDLIPQPHLGE